MSKKKYLKKAFEWVASKPTLTLKAKHEDYEDPKIFRSKRTDEEFQADISFTTRGGVKSFLDIALKSDKPQRLVTKWKLLSMVAAVKRGKLYLLAPRGHKSFTQQLVYKYNINAEVQSI